MRNKRVVFAQALSQLRLRAWIAEKLHRLKLGYQAKRPQKIYTQPQKIYTSTAEKVHPKRP